MTITTVTTAPRHARPSSRPPSRLRTAAGLARLALFRLTHPHAPVPAGLLNVRVPDAPRGMRRAVLDDIAAAYKTRVAKRFGCLVAERQFGPVRVEAHVKDDDYTAQLAARIDRTTGSRTLA
ncbi:MAG: hypothetical protein ACRDP7_28475 [Trebonia sp.]